MADNKLPYYLGSADDGVDQRAMVSLGPVSDAKYCHFDCQFCYVHGPFRRYRSATPEEIIEWLLDNVGKYSIIYISGDTDSFAFKRAKDALKLLYLIGENLERLNCDVLFTTRHVFSEEENDKLERVSNTFRKKGKLLIGCVSVCQLNHPELEPKPLPSPYDRIDQLGLWNKIGLSTILAIRPFIPGVGVSELVQLATHGARFADVIIGGHLYLDKQEKIIESKLSEAFGGWDHRAYKTVERPLDFTPDNDLWLEVKSDIAVTEVDNICRQLGIPFHLRSTPAVEHICKRRAYYIGRNNQRMFAANILASVSIQISLTTRTSMNEKGFLGELEMGFNEFVGSHIKRFDVHPKITDFNHVGSGKSTAVIDADSFLFQGAFKMLQEELQTLFLNTFGEKKVSSQLSAKLVLFGSPEEIGKLFGSVPLGWDAMVRMKRELLTRNRTRSARAKWFCTLFADTEKILRDLVCTSILNMGTDGAFRLAIEEVQEKFSITNEDVGDPSRLEAISQDFATFMASDAALTFQVARKFFSSLRPQMSTRNLASISHMRDDLRELGSDRVQILEKLLEYRKAALHDADIQDYFPHKHLVKESLFDEVTEWTVERCKLVVQFLSSICVEAALCGFSAIISSDDETALELAPLLKTKANSEFRVHSLSLLENEAFWLAYIFAEAADYYLEDGESVMLKLNAAYAFQKIAGQSNGRFVFKASNVPEPKKGIEWHPKHMLIRKSLLEDLDGLRETMLAASTDMSIEEFMNWPALEYVRRQAVFKQTIEEIEEKALALTLGEIE